MKVRAERRECFGREYPVFIGEFEGVEYRLDPVERAMEKAGIGELSEDGMKSIAGEILGFIKTGRRRAHIGSVLRFIRREAEKGKPVCQATLSLALPSRQRLF